MHKRNISEVLERGFFATFGIICLFGGLYLATQNNTGGATSAFAFGFLSFFYGNFSRFKRFKGLGFEAELWDDKKKEADALVQRLKNVVSIYTEEIVMGKVMAGRFGGGENRWGATLSLVDRLINQHKELGQEIDFDGLIKRVQQIMIFDAVSNATGHLMYKARMSKSEISSEIDKKFGPAITDPDGFGLELEKLRSAFFDEKDQFERSRSENVAKTALQNFQSFSDKIHQLFEKIVPINQEAIDDLKYLAIIYDQIPCKVTPEMLERIEKIIKYDYDARQAR
jgi:hypothetical protein